MWIMLEMMIVMAYGRTRGILDTQILDALSFFHFHKLFFSCSAVPAYELLLGLDKAHSTGPEIWVPKYPWNA